MNEITAAEEALCRLICQAEGVDPDRRSIGCGGIIERDKPYALWEARLRVARAVLEAGYPPPN